jgi:GT2 family glycosyltransferase
MGIIVVDLTIVLCTRNRSDKLQGALDALRRVRSAAEWEAVLVDNGSTDATKNVIADATRDNPRVRYVYEPQAGVGAARDAGWRAALGQIISFTDDDCYVDSRYVDSVLEVFREHKDIGYVGGRILLFDPEDAPFTIDERDKPANLNAYDFIPAGAIHGANLSFRRTILEEIGGVDRKIGVGTLYPFEDIDLVARAAWSGIKGRFDPLPVVLHHHRRRLPDLPALEASYDRGRGAYYMKFILRPDSRRVYVNAWMQTTFKSRGAESWRRRRRELVAARSYLNQTASIFRRLRFGPQLWLASLASQMILTVSLLRAAMRR